MKTVFFLIFAFLLFHGQFSAQTTGKIKSENLIGPVHSVRIVNFDCSSRTNICQEKPYRTQVVLYDRQKNEIERTLYKADGSVEHQVKKTYNSKGLQKAWKEYYGKGVANAEGLNKHAIFKYLSGKLVEVIVYREDSIAHKSTYVYDGRGNKIQEINSGPDALYTHRDYKYDLVGNLIEESSRGRSHSTKEERTYDSFGNVIKELWFDNDSFRAVANSTYENGRLIKQIVLKPDGSLLSTTRNVYNDGGKLIETNMIAETVTIKTTIEYDETGAMKTKEVNTVYKDNRVFRSHDPVPGRLVITYNKKGLETEKRQYSESGNLTYKQTFSYDKAGKLIEYASYKANGEVEGRRIYEYDGYGNRVKTSSAVVSANGEVRHLILEQRIINYWYLKNDPF
jgi:hypothetical protein